MFLKTGRGIMAAIISAAIFFSLLHGSVSHAQISPDKAEWHLIIKVNGIGAAVDDLAGTPELAAVDKAVPGAVDFLKKRAAENALFKYGAFTFAAGCAEDGSTLTGIFTADGRGMIEKTENAGAFLSGEKALEKIGTAENPHDTLITDKTSFICGLVFPEKLSATLKAVVHKMMRSSYSSGERSCEKFKKRITERITSDMNEEKAAAVAASLKCPLGGTYSASRATASENGAAAVTCSHKPFDPGAEKSGVKNPMIGVCESMCSALASSPGLNFSLDLKKGVFKAEVKNPAGADIDLHAILKTAEAGISSNFAFPKLFEWKETDPSKLPVTDEMAGALYFSLAPGFFNRVMSLPSIPAGIDGVYLIMNPSGYDFEREMAAPPLAAGFNIPLEQARDIFSSFAYFGGRSKVKLETAEIEGMTVDAINIGAASWRTAGLNRLYLAEYAGMTFASLDEDTIKTIIHIKNGENKKIGILPASTGRIKYAGAFRADLLASTAAFFMNSMLFAEENAACVNKIFNYYEKMNKARKGEPFRELTTEETRMRSFMGPDTANTVLRDIPAELKNACPRGGLVVEDGKLKCVVHNTRRQSLPPIGALTVEKRRWLVFEFARRVETTVFEARMAESAEVSK